MSDDFSTHILEQTECLQQKMKRSRDLANELNAIVSKMATDMLVRAASLEPSVSENDRFQELKKCLANLFVQLDTLKEKYLDVDNVESRILELKMIGLGAIQSFFDEKLPKSSEAHEVNESSESTKNTD